MIKLQPTFKEVRTLMIKHSLFFVMAGLILVILSCCSLFIMLCNGLKVSEYEAYWLMGFPLIYSWADAKK